MTALPPTSGLTATHRTRRDASPSRVSGTARIGPSERYGLLGARMIAVASRSSSRTPGAALAAPGVLEALRDATAIILAPSNPYLSLGPILAVRAIRAALESRRVRSIAVSPLVGGKAVTGPLDRMLLRMAGGTTPAHVVRPLGGLIDALVIDEADAPAEAPVELVAAATLMHDREAARRLAERVLEAACA